MKCHRPNRRMDFQCVSLARKPVRQVRALEALRQRVNVSLESYILLLPWMVASSRHCTEGGWQKRAFELRSEPAALS